MSRNSKCFICCMLMMLMFFQPGYNLLHSQSAGGAVSVPGSGSSVPAVQLQTEYDILVEINESVSQDLFGVPLDEDHYEYRLEQKVEGTEFYSGTTYAGDQFTFEVLVFSEIETPTSELSASQLLEIEARELERNIVVGVLTSSYGSAAIGGYAMSQYRPDTGEFESGLFIRAQFDIDDPDILSLQENVHPPTEEASSNSPDGPGGEYVDGAAIEEQIFADFSTFPTMPPTGNLAFGRLYVSLFGVRPLANEFLFETNSEITAVGSYTGVTQRNQSINVEIDTLEAVTPLELGFDEAQSDALLAGGNEFFNVSGSINGESITGTVSNSGGQGHLAISEEGLTSAPLGLLIIFIPIEICITELVDDEECLEEQAACEAAKADCEAACDDEHDVDQAEEDYQDAVDEAQDEYDADLQTEQDLRDALIFTAKGAAVAGAAACGVAAHSQALACALLLLSIFTILAGIACTAALAVVVAACEALVWKTFKEAASLINKNFVKQKRRLKKRLDDAKAAAKAALDAVKAANESCKAACECDDCPQIEETTCFTIFIPIPVPF